jgi:hypothetical protein
MSQKRAKVGGEVGANGEMYKGGRFINTIPENEKKEGSHGKARKIRKVEIEPYVWVMSDRRPILSIVGSGACYIDRSDWTKGIMPYEPAIASGYADRDEVQTLCDRFNAGERFI